RTDELCLIIGMGTIALVSFAAGLALTSFNPLAAADNKHRFERFPTVPYSTWFLLFASLLVILVAFHSDVTTIGSYEGSYSTTYKSPAFQLLCSTAYFSLCFIAAIIRTRPFRKRSLLSYLIIFSVIAFGLYSSDKDPIVVALLALTIRFAGQKS